MKKTKKPLRKSCYSSTQSLPKLLVKTQKVSANALTKSALTVLRLNGFHCWRQNNGGVYDPIKKVFRKNSSTPGISDIIGYNIKTGKFLACEIKVGKDKCSQHQTEFLNGVQQSGGYSCVISHIDELISYIKKFW